MLQYDSFPSSTSKLTRYLTIILGIDSCLTVWAMPLHAMIDDREYLKPLKNFLCLDSTFPSKGRAMTMKKDSLWMKWKSSIFS